MLTSDELAERRQVLAGSADLQAGLVHLAARNRRVLDERPHIPRIKPLLSVDGGVCPTDGAPLVFDPWSPEKHRCSRCGSIVSGERHYGAWVRQQHLWVAERAADLATVSAFTNDPRTGQRAEELLSAYGSLYFDLPNHDNILGPSHLFFSTYLESLWITSYLGAAWILRETGVLSASVAASVDRVAEEAAAVIGDFDEGMSNRQTWNSAALGAIAAWFNDDDLARSSIATLLGHLADGYGDDGMWYEGENYHLFALRGLMTGIHWARADGTLLLEDPEVAKTLAAALFAPARTALPDLSYPARKDSRFGVSLAQPMYLELWEIGRAWLPAAQAKLEQWLASLYASPSPALEPFDCYLHEAGEPKITARSRADLSWWSFLTMPPAPPVAIEPWREHTTFLPSQGLAILRHEDRYASLECGSYGGGHGHPDRLHLSLHALGIHWLPDFGTGSYVSRDLFWYRSTLAHNAPLLDGGSQPMGDARCEAFDVLNGPEEWAWVRGSYLGYTRSLVAGPTHLVDLLEFQAKETHSLELPWHVQGETQVSTPGLWEPTTYVNEFVSDSEIFRPTARGTICVHTDSGFALHLLGGELLRVKGPAAPNTPTGYPFYLVRASGAQIRFVAIVDLAANDTARRVNTVSIEADTIRVHTAAGNYAYSVLPTEVTIDSPQGRHTLRGVRPKPASLLGVGEPPIPPTTGRAVHVAVPPTLDGTLEGFDQSEPLILGDELQYRRSEEPYAGPEHFSATTYMNWDESALYLAADVSKPEVIFRNSDAPPLGMDNEVDDIHSDGLQVYWQTEDDAAPLGVLIVPDPSGSVRARNIEGYATNVEVTGQWQRTNAGYLITLRLPCPSLHHLAGISHPSLAFDLLVNEMRPDRTRRAGQLVWGGSGGWVYLRGDRHSPSDFGILELA